MSVAGIDPGKTTLAIARSMDRYSLDKVFWFSFPDFAALAQACRSLSLAQVAVIEKPRIYPKFSRKDPNDLINVAMAAGVAHLLAREVQIVYPAEWKGQVPKKIHNKRVIEALHPDEKKILTDSGYARNHNVIDAIGILMRYLKRI